MKALRAALFITTALVATSCVVVDEEQTSTVSQGLEIHVPGDYPTIQAAVNAATAGSTVLVAAGDYTENVRLKTGIHLVGAGRDLTTLHGQIRFYSSENVEIAGFLVTAEGASGYSPNIGIAGAGCSGDVHDNTVEGFGSGIGLEACSEVTIIGNLLRLNQAGIEMMETDTTIVANNVIHHNQNAGIILFADTSPDLVNNTIVGNGYAQEFDLGGAGVVLATEFFGELANNIIVSNHGGINALYYRCGGQHNLVWGNTTNYIGNALVGTGDISQDPLFLSPAGKDYRIREGSPAIDAGIGWALTTDFAGNVRPSGAALDLGAFEFQVAVPEGDLVITEVMANPTNEATGEFIELYNPSSAAIDAAGLVIDDGDSPDPIVVYPSSSGTMVPAGGYAVVLDRDYVAGSTYDIPGSAVLLSVPNAAIGSGLSTNDPITLSRGGTIVSSYNFPFNPGDGLSAERIDPDGPDAADNWVTSPCGSSPGRANCITSGGGPAGLPTLVISEVMANPADQSVGEYVEVYNFGEDAVELAGLVLSDGDSTDTIVAVSGRASSLPAGSQGIIIDPDYVSAMTGSPYFLTSDIGVVVTVTGSALGNGLASNDPVAILDDDGQTPITTFSHPVTTSSQSIERIDPLEADLVDNWTPCPCPEKHSAGRPNCASDPSGTVETPGLLINEVMANALDEDLGEFVEIYNPQDTPVDVAGLVLSDGDATDVIGPFPGMGGNTTIPARGFGLVLDPEYAATIYSIPSAAVLLAPDDTTLGNGLATDDPITLFASDGRTKLSAFSFPFNPGNGISVERKGDTGDIQSNWVASTCTSGSSPGAVNCSAESGPEPTPEVLLVISEVMSNPVDEARGEFVEVVNRGDAAVTLDGFVLSDGDATDTIQAFAGGSTELLPGAIGLILDQSYADLTTPPYTIPSEAVLLTTDDLTIGSGLSTDDPVTILEPDGTTVVATCGFPFNPGDGISVERIDLEAPDAPENWVASPCASGSSPGAVNCAGAPPAGSVVDVNTATQEELDQVTGIGPSTASAIVSYRTAHGPFESLRQLTVIDGITQDKINDWMVSGEGEDEHVIGLAGARELVVFAGVADLVAALPDPAGPGAWEGTPVRIQRAVALDATDSETKQQFTFADWGDEAEFEPSGGTVIPVFLDLAPGETSYTRSQTNHANAMQDWIKEDGDPYLDPDFYRWPSPLWSFGTIAYANVFALEGVVEVHNNAWRLRIRGETDTGIDRVVLIERWLPASDWDELQVVWTYSYKPVVVESTSGYTYSLPYRLALAHPARQVWYDTHGVWLDVPRCAQFGECTPCVTAWNQFNAALAEWNNYTPVDCSYEFEHESVDYCFSIEEEAVGVEILNNADFVNLTGHCYTTTLANVVIANRPYSSIAQYDSTAGVGTASLWNLLVCYIRSGDWPPAPLGTVQRVVQDIPGNEWMTVTIGEADIRSIDAGDSRLFEICDPPGPAYRYCIPTFCWETIPATLTVGDLVTVRGQVYFYIHDHIWEIQISGPGEYVTILEER